MQNQPQRPSWQIGALFFVGLGAVLAGGLYVRHLKDTAAPAAGAAPATQAAAVYQTPRPMPDFALTDDDGRPAGPGAFRGGWSLLFFGYTHCPDACPATLAELAQVERALADLPVAARPHVWLLSVDPARDTVPALHEYVRYFSPSFRALTGDEAAVQALTLALGIPVVSHHGQGADYTVDHSVAILLVNPHGELVAVFPPPHQVRVVAADYRAIVTAPGAVAGTG